MSAARAAAVLLLLLCAGCSRQQREPAIGEGFVVPATLNLREDLGPRQPTVGSAKHGDRVEILARRRRFAKVRTQEGAVGWIDGALLFTPEQMAELRALGEFAAALPSQGAATVLEPLNVHTHAERQSPSFYQVLPGERVEVVAHKLVPRSGTDLPPDDWNLVRRPTKEAGWVLARMLYLSIPDEVAQYAEGHRITSYFSLGEVNDDGRVRHNWLWTTIKDGRQPYQFDSFRVFVWSLRRHRYETAYIERNLKGYFPGTVEPGAVPRFSLVVEDKDGTRLRKTYTFQGFHVRLVAKAPAEPVPDPPGVSAAPAAATPPAAGSVWSRLSGWFAGFRRRVSGD